MAFRAILILIAVALAGFGWLLGGWLMWLLIAVAVIAFCVAVTPPFLNPPAE